MRVSLNFKLGFTVECNLVDLENGHVVGEVERIPVGVNEGLPGGGLEVTFLWRVPDFVGSNDNLEAAEAIGAVGSGQDVLVGWNVARNASF